jgi:glucoamylase
MARGGTLRIQTLAPCVVHWSADGWRTIEDTPSTPSNLGDWYTDLPTAALAPGDAALFTFRWPEVDRWEGADFRVEVTA